MPWENLQFWKKTRARTLSMVRGLTQEQFDFEPRPGKWSIGEQLDHLILSDKLYRRDISELIALDKAGKTPEIHRTIKEINFRPNLIPAVVLPWLELPFILANLFIPTALREFLLQYNIMPAQRPDVAQPQKGKPAAELVDALAASLDETVRLIENNRGLKFHRMTVDHPVLGRNDLPEIVRLTALHEIRHQGHIDAILRKLRAPVASAA